MTEFTDQEAQKMRDFMFSAGMVLGALTTKSFRENLAEILKYDQRTRHYMVYLRDKLNEVLPQEEGKKE